MGFFDFLGFHTYIKIPMRKLPPNASKKIRKRYFVKYVDESQTANPWHKLAPSALKTYTESGGKGYLCHCGMWASTRFDRDENNKKCLNPASPAHDCGGIVGRGCGG